MSSILIRSKYIEGLKMQTIGELIPINKITLIHGRSGCGKTLSILKYLFAHDVEPVLLDFDTNDGIGGLVDIVHLDGYIFWDNFIMDYSTHKKDDIRREFKNKVFVIDTYAMSNNYIKESSENKYDIHSLCEFLIECESTVVVISHTLYYSGKDSQPDVDSIWANHIGCKLHLHKDILKTKTNFYLEIEKLRGYAGSDIINDWMR